MFDFQQELMLQPRSHTSLLILTLVTAAFKVDAALAEVGSFLTLGSETLRVRLLGKVEILAERRTLRITFLAGDSLLSI